MAMWNETSLDITFEDGKDHSDEVKSCFSMTTLEDEPSMLIYNKSLSQSGNSYHIEYHERGYFDYNEMLRKARDLAAELPHSPFSLSVGVFNEGSGGNYHDEFRATYKYGALDWKYYCDYEQEDKWDSPPQLVNSDREQLYPELDFIKDIAEDEKKEQVRKEREHLLQTGTIKNIESKVFITTGLTVDEEKIVRDVVERSGGVFKEKFVKGINYLVFNPDYGRETTKLRDAKALIAEGKDVKIITMEQFKELLFSATASKNASATKKTPDTAKKSGNKAFKYNSKVSFELPKGYQVVKGKSEDGTDTFTIKSKPYTDDNGEKQYRFACGINDYTVEYKGALSGKKKLPGRTLLEETVKDVDGIHYFYLPGTPAGMMLCKVAGANADDSSAAGMLANILILMGRPFALNLRVVVDDHTLMEFLCMGSAALKDDPDYMPQFEGILTVAQSLRINGEPLHLGKMTPKILESAFSPRNLDYKESSDITKKLNSILSDNTGSGKAQISEGKGATSDVTLPLGFPTAEVKPANKRLLDRKPKKTDSPNRFDLHLKYGQCSSGVALYYYDKVWPGFTNKKTELLRSADEMVTLFRDDQSESDVESELRQGYIRHGRTLHVLRSFVWTSVEYCNARKEELAEFSLEQSIDLAQFIFDCGGANYQTADKKTKRIGAGLLTKSEKDHGYSGVSYVNMVQSLHALLPIMERIYAYLSEKQGELSDAEKTMKDVLAGWCAYSLACFTGFSVEAGPEDFIPEKCRELPVDTGELRIVSKYFYVDHNNTCVAYTGASDVIEFPEGIESVDIPKDYSHISGSREYWYHPGTIVFPTTCRLNSTVNWGCSKDVKRLVFKGDTDVIDGAYSYSNSYSSDLVWLEEIEFLGNGNKINSYAFKEYPKLKKVVLPKSLTVIGNGAFRDTPLLKDVQIPPSVREIGEGAFFGYYGNTLYKPYDGTVKTLIVEKGSPAEPVVRKHVEGRQDLSCKVVLSEAEQKRIEEESRLKRIATNLQQKLAAMYQDRLDWSQFDSLKNAATITLANMCDKQTWAELCNRRISALPNVYLKDTAYKVTTAASPEEAYELLPEWIASEYIKTAEDKRKLQAFEQQIRGLTALSKESVLPHFENGVEKNEIVGQIVSKAKTLLGDGASLSSGLAQYDSNAALETLRLTLGRKLASVGEIIDAITAKKSEEYDRLSALLEKKKTDIDAIQQEAIKLEEERSHLGFFQGKRKKEIAALLEKIPGRIKQIEEDYEREKKLV